MDRAFDSIESLIIFIFKNAQKPVLSFDYIVTSMSDMQAFVQDDNNLLVLSSQIPKKVILAILQSSETFVQCDVRRDSKWALQPKRIPTYSDSFIRPIIIELLSQAGPLTLDKLNTIDINDPMLILRFITIHSQEFCCLESGEIWFTDKPVPVSSNYISMEEAINCALHTLKLSSDFNGIFLYLCKSTILGQRITKDAIWEMLMKHPERWIRKESGVFCSSDEYEACDVFNVDDFFNLSVPFQLV